MTTPPQRKCCSSLSPLTSQGAQICDSSLNNFCCQTTLRWLWLSSAAVCCPEYSAELWPLILSRVSSPDGSAPLAASACCANRIILTQLHPVAVNKFVFLWAPYRNQEGFKLSIWNSFSFLRQVVQKTYLNLSRNIFFIHFLFYPPFQVGVMALTESQSYLWTVKANLWYIGTLCSHKQ